MSRIIFSSLFSQAISRSVMPSMEMSVRQQKLIAIRMESISLSRTAGPNPMPQLMNTRWRSSRFSHHVLQYYSITSWLNRMIFSIHRIVAGYNSFQYEVSIEVKLTGWWMFCPTFVSTSSVKTRKERDCRTYSSNFASIE